MPKARMARKLLFYEALPCQQSFDQSEMTTRAKTLSWLIYCPESSMLDRVQDSAVISE
jgi:hypothetical protein